MKSITHQLRVAAGGIFCGAACMLVALLAIGRLFPTNINNTTSVNVEKTIVAAERQ